MPELRIDGPSSNAWGALLGDIVVVQHQGLLVSLARDTAAPTSVLYLRVLDPSATADAVDSLAWNGWYRFTFPEAVTQDYPLNATSMASVVPELRPAGMDLLTVSPDATTVQPANSAFAAFSDGTFITVLRPSVSGTLYLNRLMLQSRSEEVDGVEVTRYALELAWEVRFQRSGVRDVPLNDTDRPSYRDSVGVPFIEPTIECPGITGIANGAFAATIVGSSDPTAASIYVGVTMASGVQLYQLRRSDDNVIDTTVVPTVYPLLSPTMQPGATPLTIVQDLGPAMVAYAEAEMATSVGGSTVELPRQARLMVGITVGTTGLPAALAVFDMAIAADGSLPPLAASDQTLLLVDGTLSGGTFTPDTSSPAFPTPAQSAATTSMVGGLSVRRMLLGQVQPQTSPLLYTGDDGLLHCYYGGPSPTGQQYRWQNLVPGMPQAMVAQFDPRVNRLLLSAPWQMSVPSEQANGSVDFVSLLTGSLMDGATVAIAPVTFGPEIVAMEQADLCTVSITYPAGLGLPNETWTGVPRDLAAFMGVLNGGASDDTADPRVLSGTMPYFDFSGTEPIVRIPLTPPVPAPSSVLPQVLTFASTRTDVVLTGIDVSDDAGACTVVFTFQGPSSSVVTITWAGVPASAAAYADLFDGVAAASTYTYPSDPSGTVLLGLTTDAAQVPTSVLFIGTGLAATMATTTIAVQATNGTSGTCTVVVVQNGQSSTFDDVPTAVADFVSTLTAAAGFSVLGLVVTAAGAAGNVVPTSTPATPLTLQETASLFDLVMPSTSPAASTITAGSYPAGTTSHVFDPAPSQPLDITRMAGFLVSSVEPENGAPAYVLNTATQNMMRGVTRTLAAAGEDGAEALSGGVWLRQTPQVQCSFAGTDSVTVPVVNGSTATPQSTNLRPQRDWTVESWFLPNTSSRQQLLSFHDGVTPVPAGAPSLDYQIAIEAQQVAAFGAYTKTSGTPDTAFFQTGTSGSGKDFMPSGAFTWECWIQPLATPTSSPSQRAVILQLQKSGSTPFLVLALNATRQVMLVTLDQSSQQTTTTTTDVVAAVDADGIPTWTHLALIGVQDETTKTWTISIMIDQTIASVVTDVALQSQPGAYLVIGCNNTTDVSMFGQMAQLRYWSIARSPADIRRTWFVGLSGTEAGLLGNWPMSALQGTAPSYLINTVPSTGTGWDAMLTQPNNPNYQKVTLADDSFFLSTVATIGGAPAIEADTMLANGQWNHLALVYRAGGAVRLNPQSTFALGRYDWLACGSANGLGPLNTFAIDAWVLMDTQALQQGGTIIARWAPDTQAQDQGYRFWVNDDGEMVLDVVVISSNAGDTTTATATSSGADLLDGSTHHVAVVFTSQNEVPDPATPSSVTATFYRDGTVVGTTTIPLDDVMTVLVQASQTPVTIGRSFIPPEGSAPMIAEDFAYFRGTLGRLRFWSVKPTVQNLFPECYPRIPQYGMPGGVAAEWSFREQTGTTAFDSVGSNDAHMNTSAPWASLNVTSTLDFYANGALIGTRQAATGSMPTLATSQFTMGMPLGVDAGTASGFIGQIAQVSLWNRVRSIEEIQDQQYVPPVGDAAGLVACWTFANGGTDITGGGNDANPTIASSRLTPSSAPLSNEGPVVCNVYGGVVTTLSGSCPGRIGVGSYADAQGVGTTFQRGVLKRQYILDPNGSFDRPIQIGELDLIYLGNVQTKPTLIGYIEGAPPVPSENLTRPYYLDPGGAPYIVYCDTSKVSLVQESGRTLSFTSNRAQTTQVDVSGAFGILGIRSYSDISVGIPPFSIETNSWDLRGIAQLKANATFSFNSEKGSSVEGTWRGTQTDIQGLSGDWEGYQANPADYFNPTVGRRFLADNLGYALVESLTADLYALVFKATETAVGTMVLPNPDIPPDRNIIMFPIDNTYTKATTLDGKIGLMNDPDYPDADIQRGSFFKPVEAYAMAATIRQRQQQAESYAKQFSAYDRALASDTDLSGAAGTMPVNFDDRTLDPVSLGVPMQGLVNRYVWTSDGMLHSEEQSASAMTTTSYSGFFTAGGGGGFHADGEFFFYAGFAWSLDIMASHQVTVTVSNTQSSEQAVRMDIAVEGEAYLKPYDPSATPEYPGSTGAFLPYAAPGKVTQYRFMSFYLPPSSENSDQFRSVVDPVWLRMSNSPMARAMREINLSNATWRVLHRVTYVQRVPPPIASRPMYSPLTSVREPVNMDGNATLLRLVDAQLVAGNPIDRVVVGTAVAAVMNPAPTAPGVYPVSTLEGVLPWWATFLASARPDASGVVADPAAASLLYTLVSRVTNYAYDAYASGLRTV